MTEGQFQTILSFFLHSVASREEFKKHEDDFFSLIQKRFGLSRNEFAKRLAERLSTPNWKHGLTDQELIELAHRVNSYPVYMAVAKKVSPSLVKQEFPSLEKRLAAEQAPPGTSFTSTANVAAYPVPIGKRMLRRGKKQG